MVCVGRYSLDRGCDLCCGDQSLHWMLSRASSLLCGCHSPVRGKVCSPDVRVEAPRSVSELWCEVGGTQTLPLGDEPLSIPLQELSTGKCTLWCHLSLNVQAHKVHYCLHCLQPCLTMGTQAIGPGVPQALCSQSHQCRSVGTDPLKSGIRIQQSHTWTHCGS